MRFVARTPRPLSPWGVELLQACYRPAYAWGFGGPGLMRSAAAGCTVTGTPGEAGSAQAGTASAQRSGRRRHCSAAVIPESRRKPLGSSSSKTSSTVTTPRMLWCSWSMTGATVRLKSDIFRKTA